MLGIAGTCSDVGCGAELPSRDVVRWAFGWIEAYGAWYCHRHADEALDEAPQASAMHQLLLQHLLGRE